LSQAVLPGSCAARRLDAAAVDFRLFEARYRLIHDSIALVERGYLKLLRGL
jgi:hypothetical protein